VGVAGDGEGTAGRSRDAVGRQQKTPALRGDACRGKSPAAYVAAAVNVPSTGAAPGWFGGPDCGPRATPFLPHSCPIASIASATVARAARFAHDVKRIVFLRLESTFFAIHSIPPGGLHTVEVTGSNPVLPTSPVGITGVIPEEPALTRVVTAGSGVLCGFVLTDADACGVAFRIAMDAHFASHIGEPRVWRRTH
jgi:hypothetical protein